jgi:hypothetical protein
MGCCSSSGSQAPLNTGNANSNANNRQSKAGGQKKEDKIELAFKVKRANIFTESVDLGRQAYVEKKIPKSAKQTKAICESNFIIVKIVFIYLCLCSLLVATISQNYIFASLNEQDLSDLTASMDIVEVTAGENIITQGNSCVIPYILVQFEHFLSD